MRARLHHFVQKIEGLVLQLVPPAATLPAFQVDRSGALNISFKYRVETCSQRLIGDRKADLVVSLETAVVEVAGADGAPHSIDRHDLLVQKGVRVFEQLHAAIQ